MLHNVIKANQIGLLSNVITAVYPCSSKRTERNKTMNFSNIFAPHYQENFLQHSLLQNRFL
jgi:hypothetical protein